MVLHVPFIIFDFEENARRIREQIRQKEAAIPEGQVGFISNLIKGVSRVAQSFLGITPRAPVRQALARVIPRSRAGRIARTAGALAAGGAAFEVGAQIAGQAFGPDGQPIIGGNGNSFRRTLVQTIDRETGEVEKTIILRGAPFIMRHDIIVAKRVIRMAQKLGRVKGISRTVKQSITSKTKDAIEAKVLAEVTKGVC